MKTDHTQAHEASYCTLRMHAHFSHIGRALVLIIFFFFLVGEFSCNTHFREIAVVLQTSDFLSPHFYICNDIVVPLC